MVRHYSTRDFFRQMPNALLARYFAERAVFANLDFVAMPETRHDDLFAAWLVLPYTQRNILLRLTRGEVLLSAGPKLLQKFQGPRIDTRDTVIAGASHIQTVQIQLSPPSLNLYGLQRPFLAEVHQSNWFFHFVCESQSQPSSSYQWSMVNDQRGIGVTHIQACSLAVAKGLRFFQFVAFWQLAVLCSSAAGAPATVGNTHGYRPVQRGTVHSSLSS
jgi:hypothetical protein